MISICKRCGGRTVEEALDDCVLPRFVTTLCPQCAPTSNLKTLEKLFESVPLYRETDVTKLPDKAFQQVINWKLSSQGIMLVGKTGRGKTRLMWKAIENILTTSTIPVSIFVFDCVSFGHELSRAYKRDEAEDWLDKVAQADLVAFDDIGKQKFTDRVESELFGIVERRMALMKPILCTTEEDTGSLSSHMTHHRGPALLRRLRQCCQLIKV